MQIKESAENYLETIYMLGNQKDFVRSIDVANELGYSKASVSVAMKAFRQDGYIIINPEGGISLTEKGLEIAKKMSERHNVIAKALMYLGVSEKTAYADSCKIEHDISQESFDKIKEFLSHKD